jgi:hypothetical protein
MSLTVPRTVLFACLLAVVAMAAPAQAQDTRTKILRECQDGALSGDYTPQEIRDARNNIPDDIDQYSNCRDVLSRALQNAVGGGGDGGGAGGGGGGGGAGGGGGGGAGGAAAGGGALTPATDEDRNALEDAAAGGGQPVEIGGRPIKPGSAGLEARNDLPSTLIVVLALLAALALVGAAPFVRRHGLAPAIALFRRGLPGRPG